MYKKNIYRKRTASLLLAALMLTTPAMNVMAEESSVNKEETEEIITPEDASAALELYNNAEAEWEEIYIDSVDDLKTFAGKCRLDTWSLNKKVYLTEDLDLTDSGFVSIPTFGGYFDGRDHTIAGLAVREPVSYTGLFCYTQSSAVIINLHVKGVVHPSGKQAAVGGVVGDNSGILMNCSFEGIVRGNDYVGGIAGINEICGILMDCRSSGKVTGSHYTGGIAGHNMGNIVRCINESDVNISHEEEEKSIEDINVEEYTLSLLESGDETQKDGKESINSKIIDSGGVAGLSTGIIQSSANKGTVGYEHVGYNTGGIAGRQSGYVYECENTGTVYGRRDVGGIVGQTEPYIAIDLAEDIAYRLSENIDKMHDLTDKMLGDAGSESDTLHNRLSMIQDFTGKALDDTSFLADRTVEWTDEVAGSVNDMANRLDFVMNETSREGGMIDQTRYAAGNIKEAAGELEEAVEALDIYQYMTPEEKERYDSARADIENAGKEHTGYYEEAMRGYHNYYINIAWQTPGSGVDDIRPVKGGSVEADLIKSGNYEDFIEVTEWVHYDEGSGTITDEFPSSDDARREADEAILDKTAELSAENADLIAENAASYADRKYQSEHDGKSYPQDIKEKLEIMTDIAMAHESEMTENSAERLEDAAGYTKEASENFENAGEETKNLFNTLNNMPDITMPQLGEGYRTKTNSLTSNLKSLSENIGYLNDEMSSTDDVLLNDLEELNDQFSTVMRLYTDAIDGVLDMDYSNIYKDNSQEDAETSTEATIANCKNSGEVRGDINVAGIAGTMAIEYEFDLEGDVTGIEDARLNSTFLTKCVLRENVNSGKVTAQKSYVGGITGLQEMGTVLGCENYGRITSSTGNYAGGIAGQSYSYIMDSYAKCSLSGEEYVGGIAGWGSDISNCYAMVRIQDAAAFFGAVAGEVDENSVIKGNFFVGEELTGIDRISYSGMAEPVSYGEMIKTEGLPDKFRMMQIVFYADKKAVETIECPYGGTVTREMYPEIPVKQGFYADWDREEVKNVIRDEDIRAEYVRYLTTIASEQMRQNGQSAILVDGTFKKEAVPDTVSLELSDTMPEDAAEHWKISFPDDGNGEHRIRYQAPLGQTEGVTVYIKHDGEWIEAETELMGIYHLFTIEGTETEIAVCIHEKGITDYLVKSIPVIIAALAVMAAVMGFRKFTKKVPKKKKV